MAFDDALTLASALPLPLRSTGLCGRLSCVDDDGDEVVCDPAMTVFSAVGADNEASAVCSDDFFASDIKRLSSSSAFSVAEPATSADI